MESGKFSFHMSNFAQIFLDDPTAQAIATAPPISEKISKNHYVYAACFCHYWANVFLMDEPPWVHGDFFKHEIPTFSQPLLKDLLLKITPH
jgi:hypothetical protein